MKTTFVPAGGPLSRGGATLPGMTEGVAYSDCVRVDLTDHALLFVSGKMGTRNGELAGPTMKEQTLAALENIRTSVEQQGGSLEHIVRLRIYVTQIDPASIREVHAVRRAFFDSQHLPASTLLQVGGFVRVGGLVEIEADVVIPRREQV